MLNSTYGAGFRAGMCPPTFITRRDGTRVLVNPVCPFSRKRLIARALWFSGSLDGQMKRLSQPLKRSN